MPTGNLFNVRNRNGVILPSSPSKAPTGSFATSLSAQM
jgi:hypothetical protein